MDGGLGEGSDSLVFRGLAATHHLLPRGLLGQSSKWLSPHPSLTPAAPGWQQQGFYRRRDAKGAPSFFPPLSCHLSPPAHILLSLRPENPSGEVGS